MRSGSWWKPWRFSSKLISNRWSNCQQKQYDDCSNYNNKLIKAKRSSHSENSFFGGVVAISLHTISYSEAQSAGTVPAECGTFCMAVHYCQHNAKHRWAVTFYSLWMTEASSFIYIMLAFMSVCCTEESVWPEDHTLFLWWFSSSTSSSPSLLFNSIKLKPVFISLAIAGL